MLGLQSRYVVVAFAFAAMSLFGQSAFADMVTDGTFEKTGDSGYVSFAGGAYGLPEYGSIVENSVTVWQTAECVGIDHSGFGIASIIPNGNYVGFLQGYGSSSASLWQSISGFQSDTQYNIGFEYNASFVHNSPTLQVYVDGTQEFSTTVTPSSTAYYSESFAYTPSSSGAHTLKFTVLAPGSTGTNDSVALIDMVSVAAVPSPEPSTLVLLGTSLVGLLCYAWRKRR